MGVLRGLAVLSTSPSLRLFLDRRKWIGCEWRHSTEQGSRLKALISGAQRDEGGNQ